MTLLEMHVEKVNKNTQGATSEEIKSYLEQLPKWEKIAVDGEERIQREYTFDDFRKALDFTVEVGEMAEEINHHPMIVTEWGKVTLSWWTHAVGGLHKNDFIAAARSDEIYQNM